MHGNSGHPKTAVTPEIIEKVHDRQVKIPELVSKLSEFIPFCMNNCIFMKIFVQDGCRVCSLKSKSEILCENQLTG